MFSNADLARIQASERIKPKKKKQRPEAQKQNEIVKRYLDAGYFVVRLNSGFAKTINGFPFYAYTISNTGTHSGLPDLLVMKDDDIRFIEVKSEKGKLSQEQKRVHELLKTKGVTVVVES